MEQAALIMNSTKGCPRLKDLYMRPVIGSRRISVSYMYNHLLHCIAKMLIVGVAKNAFSRCGQNCLRQKLLLYTFSKLVTPDRI